MKIKRLLVVMGFDETLSEDLGTLLLFARALDFARKTSLGKSLIQGIINYVSGTTNRSFAEHIQNSQNQWRSNVHDIFPESKYLNRLNNKTSIDKNKLYESIQRARTVFAENKESNRTDFWLDWHEARWHLFSGDKEKSSHKYEEAFHGCLYRSGLNLKQIIQEALTVTASLDRPNKVFLKHLKNAAISFGYDIPSTNGKAHSTKTSDFIEDWEIDLWAGHFESLFPSIAFFSVIKYENVTPRIGPLLLNPDNLAKPNYKHPNRKIKIGETWKKTIPQIVFFTHQGEYAIVKELLKKGADTNVFSDSNETPILMALEAMNITTVSKNFGVKLFNLISKEKHHPETLNAVTSKRRLLPLISAIETGQPDVVETLLKMGANPNISGNTDNMTPLYVCLMYIHRHKQPDMILKKLCSPQLSPEALDAERRYSSGLSGMSLDEIKQNKLKMLSNNEYVAFRENLTRQVHNAIIKHMPLNNLREMAKILLEYGANPNAPHKRPINGITPLMFAAEIDENSLFELMLIKKGDLSATYEHPQTGENIDCWKIAHFFKSKNIIKVMETINHKYH